MDGLVVYADRIEGDAMTSHLEHQRREQQPFIVVNRPVTPVRRPDRSWWVFVALAVVVIGVVVARV